MRNWFHLKEDFTSFKLDPRLDKHAELLFGDRDRDLRKKLLMLMLESVYVERGCHAMVWGPAGRGKTHLAKNLCLSTRQQELETVYVDCPTIRSAKEPLSTFFGAMFRSINPLVAKRFVTKFVEEEPNHPEWKKRILDELSGNETIYRVICDGLVQPNAMKVRDVLGWLGGETCDITGVNSDASVELEDGEVIARNIGAIGQMLLLAEGKNLIFLVDEAERLFQIQSGEHYWLWLSALRESFRRPPVGLILFIIATSEDYIPGIVLEPEIYSRIGSANVFSSPTFSPPDAESFLRQLLDGLVQRNPVPPSMQKTLDETQQPAACYPFTESAFEEFIQHHSIGSQESKPQELLNNLERAAQRAIFLNKQLIDHEVLQQVMSGI
jgi:Cdc6-like AAA superfamily ATPase